MKGFLVKSWRGPQGTCLSVPTLQLQPPLLDLEPRTACGGGKNGKSDKLQVASSLSLLVLWSRALLRDMSELASPTDITSEVPTSRLYSTLWFAL